MPIWFACTLFASAFLLFTVQPLVAKLLLPIYGGTPAVWNTCLLFFQLLLLAGYAYAHALAQRVNHRRQLLLHPSLAVLVILTAPVLLYTSSLAARMSPQGVVNPIGALLAVLGVTVGVPFFILSATAPLLQRWFAQSGHPSGRDPYHLYVASNLGSMLALLGYPFVWKPHFELQSQIIAWIGGYGVFCSDDDRLHRLDATSTNAGESSPHCGQGGRVRGQNGGKTGRLCTNAVPLTPAPL